MNFVSDGRAVGLRRRCHAGGGGKLNRACIIRREWVRRELDLRDTWASAAENAEFSVIFQNASLPGMRPRLLVNIKKLNVARCDLSFAAFRVEWET